MDQRQKSCLVFTLYLLLLLVDVGAFDNRYGYDPNPSTRQEFYPGVFMVQGVIYCQSSSNSKLYPLKGDVVRIACLGIDKYGYETAPFSMLSRPTDGNGYFLAKLSPQLVQDVGGVNITHCNTFLHNSPVKTCPFATDYNRGSSGAPLSLYRKFGSDMRLYSVGPFIYSSDPQLIRK